MRKKTNIIIIGSGGHAKSCIEVINSTKKFQIFGYLDKKENYEMSRKYKYLGTDKDLKLIRKGVKEAIIGIGQIKEFKSRLKMFNLLKKYDYFLPKIIASSAYVSDSVEIGEGTIVMHRCFINHSSTVGKNCIVNTGAIIEHDVSIKNHNHISTSVVINGNVSIGSKNFIGSNTVINNNVKLSSELVISSGSRISK